MAKHWGDDPEGSHQRWTPEVPRKTSVLPILLGAAIAALILIVAFCVFNY